MYYYIIYLNLSGTIWQLLPVTCAYLSLQRQLSDSSLAANTAAERISDLSGSDQLCEKAKCFCTYPSGISDAAQRALCIRGVEDGRRPSCVMPVYH